ncbi:MAG TPA: potassium transporter TrkG, partial [Roseiflexaceae bacterium]|nr:potassium transporter TrkG [Roseiflexaceae bacterium]
PGLDLSLFGQIVLLVLMQVGGIGLMVGAVLVYQLLGIRLRFADRLALRDSLGLLSAGGILRLMRNALIGVFVIEGLGALVLWLNWMPLFGPRRAAFFALFHSVSAFTNASFDLFSGSPGAAANFPTDTTSLLTISMLVILGSIGLPVLADLVRWPQQRNLSLHTRLTLATATFLLVAGTVGLFVAEQRPGSYFSDAPWPRQLLLSFFHSATSRTSGFVLASLHTMAPAAVLVLITLMFIGGSPASMGGGVTTSTFAILALELQSYVRGLGAPVVWRRRLPAELVARAAAVLVASLVVCGMVTWLLLLTHDATFDEALFETVSAFATCGFTLGLTSRLNLFGRLLLAATMFWGRLGPLTVIVALSRARPRTSVEYPEEHILL